MVRVPIFVKRSIPLFFPFVYELHSFDYHHEVLPGEQEMWNILFVNCPRSIVSFKVSQRVAILIMKARNSDRT